MHKKPKKFWQIQVQFYTWLRQVPPGTWKTGAAPLIPLVVGAVILVSAVAAPFFYNQRNRVTRPRAQSCQAVAPPPLGTMFPIYDFPAGQRDIKWNIAPGAAFYALRIDDKADDWPPARAGVTNTCEDVATAQAAGTNLNDVCINNLTTNSYSYNFLADHVYDWWIHAINSCGQLSNSTRVTNIRALAPPPTTGGPILTITPPDLSITPTPGGSTSTITPTSGCQAVAPPPLGTMFPIYDFPAGQRDIKWNIAPGAAFYALRIDDKADDWPPARAGVTNTCEDVATAQAAGTNLNDVCINNLTTNSYSYNFLADHVYDWWIHAINSCGQLSNSTRVTNIRALAPPPTTGGPILTITPPDLSITPTPGGSTSTITPTSGCQAVAPPPLGTMFPIYDFPAGQRDIKWNIAPGAAFYALRIDDKADDWPPARAGVTNTCEDVATAQAAGTNLNDVCINNLTTNSYSYNFLADHVYDWWIHAINSCGQLSNSTRVTNIRALAPPPTTGGPILTITPPDLSITPTPGGSTSTITPTSGCQAVAPPPLGTMFPIYDFPAGQRDIKWNIAPGAAFYALRIDDKADDWPPARAGVTNTCEDVATAQAAGTNLNDVCINNLTTNSYSYNFLADHVYDWWIHAINSCGQLSNSTRVTNIRALAPPPTTGGPILTITPPDLSITPTPGGSTSTITPTSGCQAVAPPPLGTMFPIYDFPAGQRDIKWNIAPGAAFYALRIDDKADDWPPARAGVTNTCEDVATAQAAGTNLNDVCINNLTTNSYSYNFLADHVYDWWIHAINSCGQLSNSTRVTNIRALAPPPTTGGPILTITPPDLSITPTPGGSTSTITPTSGCQAVAPPPLGTMFPIYDFPAGQRDIKWNIAPGAAFYALRIDDKADD